MAEMSNMSPQALAAWERLNATWGKPLTVNSAYRDPAQNAAAKGAKRSQHMHGNAFDVSTAGMSPEDRAALVQAAKSSGFTGYGGYNNSLHFDVGPSRTWGADYTGATTPDWLKVALGGGAPATQGRTSTRGTQQMAQPMTPTQQAPMGILEMMGVQKRDPSAQDQTALPFYQRDQFKNAMGGIAMAANTLSGRPDENLAKQVQANRQQRADSQSRNKTVEYLRANGRADLASMVEQGMISGQDAAGQLLAKPKDDRTALVQNYEYFIAKGYTPEEAMAAVRTGSTTNVNMPKPLGTIPPGYGVNYDDAGNPVSMYPIAGGPVEAERATTAAGTQAGNRALIDTADDSIRLINDIYKDPELESITGMFQGRLPPMSQAGTDLNVKIEQAKGQVFMSAFTSLKGAGAITEKESEAATAAIARLQREQSATAYRKSLSELLDILNRGKRRAQSGVQASDTDEYSLIVGEPIG